MRIRSIKPEILTDEKTAGLSDTEWRLFVSCIVMADDYGNFRASPAFLHTQVFWGVSSTRDAVAKAREALARVSLLSLYEVKGQSYGHVNGWTKHQRVDHPGKPLCPGQELVESTPCGDSSRESQENLAIPRESLKPDRDQDIGPGPGHRTRKRSPAAPVASESFAKFWEAYPRKVAKQDAIKAWPGDEFLSVILYALEWQAPEFRRRPADKVPYPASWINGKRWEDEKPAPSSTGEFHWPKAMP